MAFAVLAILAGLGATACDSPAEKTRRLGEAIFNDPSLSSGANQSCATCHLGTVGWTGPDQNVNETSTVYPGAVPGRHGNRKPPTSAYATFAPTLALDESGAPAGGNFWDGRATGWRLGTPAADQAQGPFLNPVEQALPDAASVVTRVCSSPNGDLFREVWGAKACTDIDRGFANIAYSIVAFEGSSAVSSFDSKYDAYLAGRATLNPTELAGLALFDGKANCARCHVDKPDPRSGRVLFTDFTFDNIGVPRNPKISADDSDADLGLGGFVSQLASDDGWRSEPFVSPSFAALDAAALEALARTNRGKQRVPTLRNVDARPAPGFVKAYMHDGYFKSLEAIVHFYNTRDVLPRCAGRVSEGDAREADCWPAPDVAENVNTSELGDLGLSADEEAQLVAFLRTLTDGAP